MKSQLNGLAREINLEAKSKGFWDNKRNIGEMLMLIVSELGEAMEADRKDKHADIHKHHISYETYQLHGDHLEFKESFEIYIKDTFEDEIADAIIRLLDLCAGLRIDIDWHIENKLKFNKTRPMLHGKTY